MPKGKKGKKDELVEPEHDKTWERAVQSQQWTLEPTVLPDAYSWPTWGALRERILHACKLIQCEYSATVRDAFAAELVKLSPPRLGTLSGLEYVFVQSMSLQMIDVSDCPNLTKSSPKHCEDMQAIIHAPNSLKLELRSCPKLKSVHVWSDQLTQLSFDGCTSIEQLICRCDKLGRLSHPPLVEVADKSRRPEHKAIRDIMSDRKVSELQAEVDRQEAMLQIEANPASIPAVYRVAVSGLCFAGTCLGQRP